MQYTGVNNIQESVKIILAPNILPVSKSHFTHFSTNYNVTNKQANCIAKGDKINNYLLKVILIVLNNCTNL